MIRGPEQAGLEDIQVAAEQGKGKIGRERMVERRSQPANSVLLLGWARET
jgi:hypothetical protein